MARNEDPYHLGQLVLDNLAERSDEICQIDATADVSETRRSLRQRSIKFAKHMTKLGLKVNDVVTACATNHNDACLPLLAGLQIGVAVNYLDVVLSKFEAKHIMEITQPKMIFCEPQKSEEFYEITKETGINAKIIIFGGTTDSRFLSIKDFYENDYTTDDHKVVNFDTNKVFSYIICSSGSTGLPKGVCHTHKSTKIRIDGMKPYFTNETMIQFGSNYWISCLWATILNATIPSKKIHSRDFSPSLLFNYLQKYQFTVTCLSPAILKMIVYHPEYNKNDLTTIKKFLLGGTSINIEDIEILKKKIPNTCIFNGYGISELGGALTYVPKGFQYDPSSVGKMHPFVQTKLVDVNTRKLITEPNQPGELYVKGDVMMAGYFNDPEGTAEVLDSDGWYATGDLCKIDKNGAIYVLDRLKDVFKFYGFPIAPALIEQVINSVPGVEMCGVIGIDNKDSGQVPMAFVKRKAGSNVSAEKIKETVKDKLAAYCELRGGVVFVDSFKMTPSGKLKRYALKELIDASKIE